MSFSTGEGWSCAIDERAAKPHFVGGWRTGYRDRCALVAGWLYVSPPRQNTVMFYTQDAASLRPGDQVRIAGVIVGKVNDLALEPRSCAGTGPGR